ncbi:uncharacterized protein LOC123695187 [Colias croceus]|uniref:uncharacterized protein LOC123695187 n=1 Tax=Colias crocea TaxID=72248 RepID=UPI001E27FBED|nr:uncharacterized protein LOC123695187 [Colias croceus]
MGVKVSPAKPAQPKINTLFEEDRLLNKFKYFILFQTLFGVNRIYLLDAGRIKTWLSYLYNFGTIALVIYFMFHKDSIATTFLVYQDTALVENLLLTLNSLILHKNSLLKFFKRINTFDEMLNIKNNSSIECSLHIPVVFLFVLFVLIAIECVLLKIYVIDRVSLNSTFFITYYALLAHDTEIIFFCVMLIMIVRRVKVLKGHVAKLFVHEKGMKENNYNTLEALSNKANLDVSSLHSAYDLLHNCSEKLNSAMNLPMIIIFITSGLSSIMLLRNIFCVVQIDWIDNFYVQALICYAIGHCMKFTILVVMPCYFSNITTTQVTIIRTMLHDAINTMNMDKIERRKLKAFFQLTRDCDFGYALWGVIKMDMSLPLSYCSLCVTYLIIVVQFSKFID